MSLQNTRSWSILEAQNLHLESTKSVGLQIGHKSLKWMSTLKLDAKLGLRDIRSGSTDVLDKVTTLNRIYEGEKYTFQRWKQD